MNKIISIFIFTILSSLFSFAQNNLALSFLQLFDNQAIDVSNYYISAQKDSLKISDIKCYISAIELEMEDGSIYKEENSFHLLDFENPRSFQLNLKNVPQKKFRFLHFNVGIDSLTSVSGALEGELDPSNGMYWAWQSGYINFKIEGKSPSCKTRKNEYQFHVGGYMQPFYAMRKVEIPLQNIDNEDIKIKMDWAKLFAHINLSQLNSVMIPSKEAMKIADWTTEIFSLSEKN